MVVQHILYGSHSHPVQPSKTFILADLFVLPLDAYTTGIVVILTRFCPPLTDILGISSIDESWLLCQEILKDMAIYGSHANRCLVSLQDLRSRLASWESSESI